MLMGKGGTGKTTIAASVGLALASRGCRVDVTTTDPAAHVALAIGDSLPAGLDVRVDAVDAATATAEYVERTVDAKRAETEAKGRAFAEADEALLREELDSPCTEELAVFDAFAAKISACEDRFVVVDTAPTGHTLMLLDQTGAYQADVDKYRSSKAGKMLHESAAALTPLELMRTKAKLFVVALPEPTPVSEAIALDADLRRAGVAIAGFVVNGLIPVSTTHPTLANRARAQAAEAGRLVARAAQDNAPFGVVGVSWSADDLVGFDALVGLAGGAAASTTVGPTALATPRDLDAWRRPLQLLLVQSKNDDGLDDLVRELSGRLTVARTSSEALRRELRLTDLPAALLYQAGAELACVQGATPAAVVDLLKPHLTGLDGLLIKKTTPTTTSKKTSTLLPSQVMKDTGAGGCCAPGGGG
mmetsp:Transcript_24565/g.75884  ORF Transcript_24565/g.75884 Transcript_24565/m.75884 type:complete len:418 (+) Transcript_24565:878-2131(+)